MPSCPFPFAVLLDFITWSLHKRHCKEREFIPSIPGHTSHQLNALCVPDASSTSIQHRCQRSLLSRSDSQVISRLDFNPHFRIRTPIARYSNQLLQSSRNGEGNSYSTMVSNLPVQNHSSPSSPNQSQQAAADE